MDEVPVGLHKPWSKLRDIPRQRLKPYADLLDPNRARKFNLLKNSSRSRNFWHLGQRPWRVPSQMLLEALQYAALRGRKLKVLNGHMALSPSHRPAVRISGTVQLSPLIFGGTAGVQNHRATRGALADLIEACGSRGAFLSLQLVRNTEKTHQTKLATVCACLCCANERDENVTSGEEHLLRGQRQQGELGSSWRQRAGQSEARLGKGQSAAGT